MTKKIKKNNKNFEINFFEGVVKKAPSFVEALSVLGDLYTKKGMYDKGLSVDRRLVKIRPEDPIVLYNLACSYSLINELDKSFYFLKKSIDSGYEDFEFLESDEDLQNIVNDVRFKEYFEKIRKEKLPPGDK